MKILMNLLILLLFLPCLTFAESKGQEKVGEVLGNDVYRSQITAQDGYKLHMELHSIFTRPVLKKYMEKYEEQIQPTQQEIDHFVAFYQKKHEEEIKGKKDQMVEEIEIIKNKLKNTTLSKEERENLEIDLMGKEMDLKGPGKSFAMFVLPHWKMQLHFYQNFGGGRILWQQRGIEAFDAMHTWLNTQEKNGKFSITDKKLRDAFYHYWTTMDHGAFITVDQQRINDEFLNPEWKLLK